MIQVPLEVKKKVWLSWGIICAVLSVASGSFTIIVIEELGSACLHQTTMLEHLGLPLPDVEKYCTNTGKHSYLNNSLIEIVGIGGYCWMMLMGYYTGMKGWKTGSPFSKQPSRHGVEHE